MIFLLGRLVVCIKDCLFLLVITTYFGIVEEMGLYHNIMHVDLLYANMLVCVHILTVSLCCKVVLQCYLINQCFSYSIFPPPFLATVSPSSINQLIHKKYKLSFFLPICLKEVTRFQKIKPNFVSKATPVFHHQTLICLYPFPSSYFSLYWILATNHQLRIMASGGWNFFCLSSRRKSQWGGTRELGGYQFWAN